MKNFISRVEIETLNQRTIIYQLSRPQEKTKRLLQFLSVNPKDYSSISFDRTQNQPIHEDVYRSKDHTLSVKWGYDPSDNLLITLSSLAPHLTDKTMLLHIDTKNKNISVRGKIPPSVVLNKSVLKKAGFSIHDSTSSKGKSRNIVWFGTALGILFAIGSLSYAATKGEDKNLPKKQSEQSSSLSSDQSKNHVGQLLKKTILPYVPFYGRERSE